MACVANSLFLSRDQDLNAVCDVNCRDSSALMFVDPQTGLIVIVDGNSTGKRENLGTKCCLLPNYFGFAPHCPLQLKLPSVFH